MGFEPLSLDQLTMFLAVAETGSFSRAGRRLGRVQSAVSHAIAGLEGALGLALFVRTGRAPRLTDAGQRLVGEARLVLAQARELVNLATELRGGTEATLQLSVDLLFPRRRLVAALATLHAEFPQTAVRVDALFLEQVVARVRSGAADLAICILDDSAPDELSARVLMDIALVPVCAPEHPLAEVPAPQPADRLRASTQIVLAEPPSNTDAEDRGVLATRTWRVTDLDAKLDLLEAGVGWGTLPQEVAAPSLRAGRLVRLHPEPWPDGHLVRMHVARPADRPLGPAGRRLVQLLAE